MIGGGSIFPALSKTRAARPLELQAKNLQDARFLEERPTNIPTGRPAILLVDDDPDILTALHDLLEHDGFLVTGVSTCRGALSRIKAAKFAAVLLDIGLPDGDGISALETIQTLAPSLPVIILTAFTSQDHRAKSLSRGAFSYLTKPYNRDELRTVLRRAVEMSRPPEPPDS